MIPVREDSEVVMKFTHIYIYTYNIYIWLVVSTPLKNISQLGLFFPIKMEK